MRTPRPLFARLGLLGLAVAYLSLYLGGTWHLSIEGHARCAEHGEWIDVDHAPAAEHACPPTGPLVRSGGAPEEHDHCVIVEASRLRAVACEDAPAVIVRAAPATIVPRRTAEPLDLGFDRYLLAPKQSPPC